MTANVKYYWLAVLLLCPASFGQQAIPEKPQSWVTDYAGILTPAQKQNLESRLQRLESETSTQVFVAIFSRLPEAYYLEDFTNRLFEKWRPGLADKDNGVLLAVFIEDRRLRIETGYGLEDVLTDLQAATVIRQHIVPHFRTGDHYAGLSEGLEVIIRAVEGKYRIPVRRQREEQGTLADWLPFIFVLFAIIMIARSRRRSSTTYSRKGYRRHPWDGPIIWGGPFGGRGGGGGGSFGGGFSGGFGGLSGGGGASGSW